jgi:hypothetical protein
MLSDGLFKFLFSMIAFILSKNNRNIGLAKLLYFNIGLAKTGLRIVQ